MNAAQSKYLGQIEKLENDLKGLDLDYNEYGVCVCGGDAEILAKIEVIERKMYTSMVVV